MATPTRPPSSPAPQAALAAPWRSGLLGAGIDVAAVDRTAAGLEFLAAAAAGSRARCKPFTPTCPARRIRPHRGRGAGPHRRIDVLVNNAGIGQASVRANARQPPICFWEAAPEQWSRFLAVNSTAPIMMARAVLPHMLAAKAGRIITVTTSLGTMVREGYLLYGASKAAAEAAMAGLSADLKGTGVTSNVLVPGGVTNTPLVGEHAGDRSRMLQPEIMVPPLLWLVSDAGAAVNGRRFIAADWDASLPRTRRRRRRARRSRGWASRACRSSRAKPRP